LLKDNINLYFGSKKERVFRILLSNKIKNLSWYKIAKLAETNYSYVHSILCELERESALKKHEISDVTKIFNLWAQQT